MKAFSHCFDLAATEKAIFEFNARATQCLESENVPPGPSTSIQLALEELLLNVHHHGQLKGEASIEVILASDGQTLSLTIRDRGLPFDPLGASAPDHSIPHEDRPIGGLGIHLVRQTSDRFEYERVDGENIVRVFWKVGSEDS